jgi:hypothetical protein
MHIRSKRIRDCVDSMCDLSSWVLGVGKRRWVAQIAHITVEERLRSYPAAHGGLAAVLTTCWYFQLEKKRATASGWKPKGGHLISVFSSIQTDLIDYLEMS